MHKNDNDEQMVLTLPPSAAPVLFRLNGSFRQVAVWVLKARVSACRPIRLNNTGNKRQRVAFSLVSFFWLRKRKKLACRARPTS